MGKDFLKIKRPSDFYRAKEDCAQDWQEVEETPSLEAIQEQAKRCMACGIPFCHGSGCPLHNNIPDINASVAAGKFYEAWLLLSATSPMPEFTSRLCPALCENSCSASLVTDAVACRQIEKVVVEEAFKNGWVKPDIEKTHSGKKVAVVGAGPAGLAAAIKLNKLGHDVTIYEKRELAGGLLRYGIPPFKLEKDVIDRRVELMKKSGIKFSCATAISEDISVDYLAKTYNAVLIATGTPTPRDMSIEGRELQNIDFALELLNGNIDVAGKDVLIIGGGDTGNDCVSFARRSNASSITQMELFPEPPKTRSQATPWPSWAYKKYKTHSDYMNVTRRWALQSVRFVGEAGKVTGVEAVPIAWEYSPLGKPLKFNPSGNAEIIKADVILLAMGYLKSEHKIEHDNIFLAGDAATGQSLVVRAVANALDVCDKADEFLKAIR